MSRVDRSKTEQFRLIGLRDWFASSLGVGPQRKEEIYVDISRAATLTDPAYWLQILFGAGIATLGLVLNSPAVIIGAMLISPLMGPILAAGLALAAGDLILGLRAVVNLALSCFVALAFAVVLVGLLPFKEMTGEIAARTQPTTLDLVVALFSGAIGSIAISREAKGVVTSIPGVAIAVALMPPLCVVGYGVGVAFSLSGVEGMQVARGGALLFLTNLVAITFTAMVVFVALHINTEKVKERMDEWRQQDTESAWFRDLFGRLPASIRARRIGSLPGRFAVIFIPILIILIPLGQSLSQLRNEITQQQHENRIRRTATALWQESFGTMPNGEPRSYIDQISVSEQGDRLSLFLRVFTSKTCSLGERSEYTRLVAASLQKHVESVGLQLVEVPTASGELAAKAKEDKRIQAPPTVAQLQRNFLERVGASLQDLRLPSPAQLVGYRLITGQEEPIHIVISYLSERDVDPDAQVLLSDDIKARLKYPDALVSFDKIPATCGEVAFGRNRSAIRTADQRVLDVAGEVLRKEPGVQIEIVAGAERGERDGIARERADGLAQYLITKWQIAGDRVATTSGGDAKRVARINLKLAGAEL